MIFIKIYTRKHANAEVHRIENLPATIGRSLDNTIIIREPSVSARHAIIERSEGGTLRLRDLGSTNGLQENGRKVHTVELGQSKSLRIGDIWAEIVDSDEPLEETVRIDLNKSNVSDDGWSNRKGLLICGAIVAGTGLERFLDARLLRINFTTHSLVTKGISFIAAALMTTIVLSVFSKVHRRRYQFFPLFAIVLGYATIIDVHSSVFDIVAFNLNDQAISTVFDELISAGIVFSGCFLISRLLFPEHSAIRRALFVAGGLGAIILAGYGIRSLNERDYGREADTVLAYPLRTFPDAEARFAQALIEIDRLEKKIDEDRNEILERESERPAPRD